MRAAFKSTMEPLVPVEKKDQQNCPSNAHQLPATPCVNDYFAAEYYNEVIEAIEKSATGLSVSNLELLELLANLHQTNAFNYKKFNLVMYKLNSTGPDIKDIMLKARLVYVFTRLTTTYIQYVES